MRYYGELTSPHGNVISIHALHYRVRSTLSYRTREATTMISIHALHYRVRCPRCESGRSAREHFNPRTPLQSAIGRTSWKEAARNISIHALHYRVRSYGNLLDTQFRVLFQSTHSITECDAFGSFHAFSTSIFQSTHSITECDNISGAGLSTISNFNPRTPLQSAMALLAGPYEFYFISIHALHYRVR